jgi:hypothetical protein
LLEENLMSRTRRVVVTTAIVAVTTLGAAGAAEASSHHHGHHGHGHHGAHGRVGDDVYSSHHPERYGQNYGIAGGLLWVVGHIL